MRTVLLEIRDGGKRYGDVVILRHFFLRLYRGSVTLLFGGTVTEMKGIADILTGREGLSSGWIRLRDSDGKTVRLKKIRKNDVSEITGRILMVGSLSVADNFFVCSGQKQPFWVKEKENRKVLRDLFSSFGIEADPDMPAGGLSHVTQCKIQFLKEYYYRTPVVLWDMRRSSFSAEERDELLLMVNTLAARGMTFLLMGDSPGSADLLPDQLVVVNHGTTVLHEDVHVMPEEKARNIYMRFEGETGHFSLDQEKASSGAVLEMKDVCSGQLNGFSLKLRRGETASVYCRTHEIMENLMQLFSGDGTVYSGEIMFNGSDLTVKNRTELIRDGMVTMDFTDPDVYSFPNFTAAEQYSFPRRVKYRGFWKGKRYDEHLKKNLNAGEGREIAGKMMTELYPGDVMKLLLRSMLLSRPKVLVCKGIFFGADPAFQQEILSVFKELTSRGTAVLILTGDREAWIRSVHKQYVPV